MRAPDYQPCCDVAFQLKFETAANSEISFFRMFLRFQFLIAHAGLVKRARYVH